MLVVTILNLLVVHSFAEQQQISNSSSLKASDGLRHVATYDVRGAGGGSNRTGNKYEEESNASGDSITLRRSPAAMEAALIPRSPALRARRKRRRVKHDVNDLVPTEPAIINPGPATVKQSENEGPSVSVEPSLPRVTPTEENTLPGIPSAAENAVVTFNVPEEDARKGNTAEDEETPDIYGMITDAAVDENSAPAQNTTESTSKRTTIIIVAAVVVSLVGFVAILVIGVVILRYRGEIFGEGKTEVEKAPLKSDKKPSDKALKKTKGVASKVAMALQGTGATPTAPGASATPGGAATTPGAAGTTPGAAKTTPGAAKTTPGAAAGTAAPPKVPGASLGPNPVSAFSAPTKPGSTPATAGPAKAGPTAVGPAARPAVTAGPIIAAGPGAVGPGAGPAIAAGPIIAAGPATAGPATAGPTVVKPAIAAGPAPSNVSALQPDTNAFFGAMPAAPASTAAPSQVSAAPGLSLAASLAPSKPDTKASSLTSAASSVSQASSVSNVSAT